MNRLWETDPRLFRMWKTANSRYQAHARLQLKNVWLLYSVSLASAFVVTISILQYATSFDLSPVQRDLLNIISVFLSIAIIVISLIEGAKNYLVRAEALYSNSRAISDKLHQAEGIIKSGSGNVDSIVADYEALVTNCPYNHETIDYHFVAAEHYPSFKAEFGHVKFFPARARWAYLCDIYGLFSSLLFITFGCVFIVVLYL